MWRWRYLKFPPLLKGVRSGNKSRLYSLVDQGEQDNLKEQLSGEGLKLSHFNEAESQPLHTSNQQREAYSSEWKAHVHAWNLLVEGLFYLCESHRLSFADSSINTKACKKIIASISVQPTSTACLVFAYILFLVNSFDKVKIYLSEAQRMDPSCCNYVNNIVLMTEGRLKAMLEEEAIHKRSNLNGPFKGESTVECNHSIIHSNLDSTQSNDIIIGTIRNSDGPQTTHSGSNPDGSISGSLLLKFLPAQVLSEEIIISIFAYLTVSELGRAGSVCKTWWRLASDFSLWKAQYIKNVFVDPEYGDADYRSMCKEINVVRRHWRIGECVETPIHAYEDPILCLQFDERVLITGSCDNTMSVWNFKDNKHLKTLEGHDSPVRTLQFHNNLLASGSANVVKIWSTSNFGCLQTLSNFDGEPVSISLFRHLLACGVRDNILLWNLEGIGNDSFLDASNEIPGHSGFVNCVQFNDMHSLLSASEDHSIKLWDIHSNRATHTMTGHRTGVQAFFSDGDFIVSGAVDGSLRFHDMRTKRCLETVQSSQGAITCVQFNDFQILTGHITGAITHWDVRCSKWDQELLLAHTGAVSCLSFDRTKIISGGLDCTVRLWDFSSGFAQATHAANESDDSIVRFSNFKAMKGQTSKFCNLL